MEYKADAKRNTKTIMLEPTIFNNYIAIWFSLAFTSQQTKYSFFIKL